MVGSSRINRSGRLMRMMANERRFFCPPDKLLTLSFRSSSLSLKRICLNWVSKSHALWRSMLSNAFWYASSSDGFSSAFSYCSITFSVSLSDAKMLSSMVSSSCRSGTCERNATRIPFRTTICPVSGSSFPMMMFMSVVLPVPFLAMKAIF